MSEGAVHIARAVPLDGGHVSRLRACVPKYFLGARSSLEMGDVGLLPSTRYVAGEVESRNVMRWDAGGAWSEEWSGLDREELG